MANQAWIFQQQLNVTAMRETIRQIAAAAEYEHVFYGDAKPTVQDELCGEEWHELAVHLQTIVLDSQTALRQIERCEQALSGVLA